MSTRRLFLTALGAAAVSACASPPAQAVGSIVDVQIVDRSRGETLPTWRRRGASWVAGRHGDRYAVRLTNRSGGRVLVVLSVDGVNAVSGDTAAVGQTGYALAPYQSAEITGWRKSYSEAAAFYFTSLPDSYAARTDRPDNVGVIGAAVFRERVVAPVQRPFDPQPPVGGRRFDDGEPRVQAPSYGHLGADGAASERSSVGQNGSARAASPAPSLSPAPMRDREPATAEKLGTGHGEREYSPTTQTAFERASATPAEVVQVRYDSYANLLASGVIARAPVDPTPDPFPRFAPDPR